MSCRAPRRGHAMVRAIAGLVALSAPWSCGAAYATEPAAYDSRRGTWSHDGVSGRGNAFELSGPETGAFKDTVGRIVAIIREAPVFNPPLGFEARARSEIYEIDCAYAPCAGKPARGRASVTLYYFIEEGGQVTWGGEANTSFELRINDTRFALAGCSRRGELPDGRQICLEPRETGRVAGFPVYGGKTLVIARPGRRPWIPVTREQYLVALIASRQASLEESEGRMAKAGSAWSTWVAGRPERMKTVDAIYERTRKTDPKQAEKLRAMMLKMDEETGLALRRNEPAAGESDRAMAPMRAGLAALRRELERMTPQQRSAPAWYGRPDDADPLGSSGLATADSADARPLVAENMEYFDRSLPATGAQLVVVDFLFGGLPASHIGARRLLECEEGIDWKRIAALTK